ncbi:short chain dehydrogenase/reductase family [Biscogniauxia mediterranea]|nr:short chain dehydrogenase/reductase family [Biscogniauxia mediterranea]
MEVNSLFDVKGKVVLVTGGARGIGRMISEGFVANGARVYIASRNAEACATTAAELTARGPGTCAAIAADLLRLEDCERLAAELRRREPRLDVLVNNSGAAWGAPVDSFPDEQWARVVTLNMQRAFTMTQLLLPLLEAAGDGKKEAEEKEEEKEKEKSRGPAAVINIGSINALTVPATLENYSYTASKAGLHHLTRHLSQVLGPRGITVNTLACGPFDTKMTAHSFKNFRAAIEEGNPMRRHGRAGDVAGACIFLASRAGSYVNGATINIDGGVHLAAKM